MEVLHPHERGVPGLEARVPLTGLFIYLFGYVTEITYMLPVKTEGA
jgi:hypothetical protein